MKRRASPSLDWIRLGGYAMLAWAAVNTGVDFVRYGPAHGMYWWFCNLAMIGVGSGMLIHHRGWVLGWLSIATFTQSLWILDNLWRITVGTNLLGLVEFMYQPGNPMDEFLLSHYHFFIMPTGFVAILVMKERRHLPWAVAVVTNAIIFGVSYFVFPPEQNVNCIHEPCIPELEHWRGPLYSILFASAVTAGCLTITYAFEKLLDRYKATKPHRRLFTRAYAAVCALALVVSAVDVKLKLALPSFRCADAVETEAVSIGCRFTLEHATGVLSLLYRIRNKTPDPVSCRTFLQHEDKQEILDDGVKLAGGEVRDVRSLLSYPTGNVVARLTADCASVRGVAGQSGKKAD